LGHWSQRASTGSARHGRNRTGQGAGGKKKEQLQNDYVFWDKENLLSFVQFRCKEFSKGWWKIQLFFQDHWHDYRDYWVPYYEVKTSIEQILLRRKSDPSAKLKQWVRDLGKESIHNSGWFLDQV
jgi:hypothetical protein